MYKLLLGMYTQYNSGIDMDNYDSLHMTSFAIFLPSKLLQVCAALVVIVGTIVLYTPPPPHSDLQQLVTPDTGVFEIQKNPGGTLETNKRNSNQCCVTLLPIW